MVRPASSSALAPPAERNAAELQAAEHVGAGRHQRAHVARQPGQERGIGLEPVLVEVLARGTSRAERERSVQAASRIDVAGEAGDVIGGHIMIVTRAGPGTAVPGPAPTPTVLRYFLIR
jgi:hypothetical protein